MHRTTLGRYFHTLRHLRPHQVSGRLMAETRRRFSLYRLPVVPSSLHGSLDTRTRFLGHDPWNTAASLGSGEFRFLERGQNLGWPPDWRAKEMPLLWQFNLHYFNYLSVLRAEEQTQLCQHWVRENPRGVTAAWHPYSTSLRIVNWCKAGVQHPTLLGSLFEQAAYLSSNLELHHPANHVVENARALIFAGKFLHGHRERWLEQGVALLERELSQQVLADGGHFERSPMYHALMLELVLDVLNICPELNGGLGSRAAAMGGHLAALTHPDGKLALFNDSTQEIAPSTEDLLAYSASLGVQPQHRLDFPDSGYFIWRDGLCNLLIDGGPIGPDHIPAHAHADIFTFELSVGNQQIICDTGVHEYQAGERRDYCRGTRAHNTLMVDGQNQAEMWSSFRVARRFSPLEIGVRRGPAEFSFQGKFNGYAHLLGDEITWSRSFSARPNLLSLSDELTGRGVHVAESFVHFHPEVHLERVESEFRAKRGRARLVFRPRADECEVIQSEYYPRFGTTFPRPALRLQTRRHLPISLGYDMQWEAE